MPPAGSIGITFWFSTKDHTADHRATTKVSPHNLHNTHVIDIEVFGIWGHDGQRGLRDEAGKLVLIPILF